MFLLLAAVGEAELASEEEEEEGAQCWEKMQTGPGKARVAAQAASQRPVQVICCLKVCMLISTAQNEKLKKH